jgi:hypothetical protein
LESKPVVVEYPRKPAQVQGVRVVGQYSKSPAWVRSILPSVSDLIFVLLLVALTYGILSNRLLGDSDIGWHIRNGQQILTTHALPRIDSFSSTMSGRPWYAWEWLYDILIGAIYNSTGLNGVVLFSGLIIAFTFSLVFRWILASGANLPISVLFLLVAASASTIHFLARPHVLSWLFAALWFRILEVTETEAVPGGRDRRLLWLPLVMLFWVNVHGAFLMGFVLLGLFLGAALLERFGSDTPLECAIADKRLRALTFVGSLCAIASLVNPYGYHLHLHIYKYLSNRFLMDHIDEFQSPNFHGLAQKCFAALILITLFTLAVGRSRTRLSSLLVVVFASYAGLYASRNIPVSSILLILIAAPTLSACIVDLGKSQDSSARVRNLLSRLEDFSQRMERMEFGMVGHLWPAAVIALSLWVCLHNGHFGSDQILNARFDEKRFPVQAANVLAQQQIREPVFSLDYWGGYLIYRLYPQLKVVVDDRHDLYGEDFLKYYLGLVHVRPGWDAVLDRWQVNWILLPPNTSLAGALKEDTQWRVVHDDGVGILFHRASGPEK